LTSTPSARPAPVRLDDLADPVFPPEIHQLRATLEDVAKTLPPLEPDVLMKAATEQAGGLHDFGDQSFRPRLELLCHALTTDVDLGAAGLVGAHSQLTSLLRNRLLIEHEIAEHPDVLDVEIRRPIVICGLPRTGTTHLHSLVAADPSLRSLPYWESLEPVLPAHERGITPDPRLARTDFALGVVNKAMPHFKRMHEMTVDHVHEEIQLLAIDFSTMLFETMAPMPTWRDAYLATDQTPSYAYLKRVMQVLTYLRGGERWVLKSPQHIEQFGPLSTVFPDATFVVTHRDPVAVTISMATMLAYSARMSFDHPDPARVGRYWSERGETMLRACVRDRDLLPPEQTIDVRFDEFMADDVAMVERIYRVAEQPFTATTRAAMDDFMATHPRGRHGSIVHDPGVLGIDVDERRGSLRFYADRFGV
jgi:hypothetical protein